MGLFGNRKKSGENLNTLSEKDIQKRLYGRYRPEHAGGDAEDASVEDRSYREPEPEETEEPETDLFSQSSEEEVEEPARQPAEHKTYPKLQPTAEEQSRIASWLKHENRTVEKLTKETSHSPAPVKKAPKKPPINYREKFGKPALNILQAVGGLIVGLIFAVDFRKPKVRRAAYVLGAALVIAGIFYGVQSLNLQREAAMKGGRSNAENSGTAPARQTAAPSEPSSSKVVSVPAATAASSQPKKETLPSAAEAKTYYVIQVATYATEEDADRVARTLADGGSKSFTRSLKRPSGKIYYSVFAGRYETYKEAEESLSSFKQTEAAKPFQDAFVRSLKLD